MKDYTQKDVYIGIDVHKKTYAVTAICNREIVKRDTLAAYPKQLVRYIKKYFKRAKVHTVYEAGFSGFHLHRYLVAAKLQEILQRLTKQAEADKSVDIMYRAVPGIGALSARILSNELEDMQQFSNEKSLFSYTGLTPSEYSSGEHKRQGSISRQGKPILRKILVQVAWRAIKKDARLAEVFERISKKAGRKRAIVAIARKLIGCIRACFVTGEVWRAEAPADKDSLSTLTEAC